MNRIQFNAILRAGSASIIGGTPPPPPPPSGSTFADLGYLGGNIDNSIESNTARLFNNAAFEGRGCGIIGSGGYTDFSLAPGGPSLTFSALSGTGVTMTVSAASVALTGVAVNDVFRRFSLGNGVSALVKATASDGLSCTVDIEGGTLPSLTVPVTGWTVGVDFDANGFPRCASVYCLSANFGYGGLQGEALVAPGTYHVTINSPSPTIAVSFPGADGMTNTTPVVTGPTSDGYTLKFDFTVASGVRQVIAISPNAPITFMDVPRDGSASSVGQPLLYAKALAYYSQFSVIRAMDFMNTNGRTDLNWGDRPKDYAVARNRYSWEFLVDFLNALKAYPGSRLKKAILCTPPFATPAYSASLAQLLNSRGLDPSLIMWIQRGNEEWNTKFKMFYNDTALAYAEVQAIAVAGYGNYMPRVTSAVGDGTTMTVTLAAALPSYITVGAPFIVYTAAGTPSWTQGSLATPATVSNVGATSFTYPSKITGSLVTTTQTAWFFNLASSLLGNGDSNLYHTVYEYHVRAQYQNWNAWKPYRPQDKFMIDSQFSNSGVTSVSLSMAAYVNGGDPTWAYGMMFAPYPVGTGTTLDGSNSDLITGTGGFSTKLPSFVTTMQSNIFACRSVGLRPICYEGGPDFSGVSNHALILACNRDPRMATFVRDLWKAWWQNGGEEGCHYQVNPSFAEEWSCLDNYDDVVAPKLTGLLAASVTPISYPESAAADSTNYKGQSLNGTLNVNGVRYPYTAGARYYTHFFTINATRQYLVGIDGTTDQTGLQVTLTLDGAPWGQALTLAKNGTPQSGADAKPCVDPFMITIPAGYHILKINFPVAYAGAGYKRVTLTPV